MKEGWKYMPLGKLCDILNGFAFKSTEYVSSGIRVIRITNVQKGFIIDNQPKFYPNKYYSTLKNFILHEGDLLMSLTGNVGRVGILPKEMLPAALNQRVACLRLKSDIITKKYLYYILNSNYFEKLCIKNSTGVAQLNMSTVWLSNTTIPLPSLSEQERIVAFLDAEFEKIDQLKANAAAQLQAAKDLFQAALKEMLTPKEGWTEKKIGDACEIIGGSTPKTKDPSNWDGDYYWVTPAELTGSKYYGVTKRTITQKGAAGLRLLPIGTVLLSSRAPIGKVAITTVPMYCNQGFKNIICPNGIYNEYVYWYILYSVPQLEELGEGTTFKELSKGRLSKFILPIPPLPEQQRIAERLDAISEKVKALQSNYDQTLTLCNDLKQALLKSIFA